MRMYSFSPDFTKMSLGSRVVWAIGEVIKRSSPRMELGRVDFLLAHRKYTRNMLARAEEKEILGGKFKVKVIKPEDLIGLKVQSSSNDSSRFHQDMADIESVISANYKNLDMNLIREYFDLFDRGGELKAILEKLKDAY